MRTGIKNQHQALFGKTRARRLRFIIIAVCLIGVCSLALYQPQPIKPVQAVSFGIVISQVYGGAGCGTAGCSTYQNDYIELYNRSKTAVTCTNCSVQYAAATGTAWQVTVLPATLTLQPGQYYLVAESFGANGVSPLPAPDTTGTIAMSATAAKVALVNSITALSGACPAQGGTGSPAILDFVGYGATANCNETANAPAPSTTTADVRNGSGNTDTDNNSTDFQAVAPTPRNTATTVGTPTAADGTITGRILTGDGTPVGGVTVSLDGTMSARTVTDSSGAYRFSDVETTGFYTVTPRLVNYAFSPSARSFSQLGSHTEAAFEANATQAVANPLDTTEFFIRQQYLDFMSREPDQGGLNYWSTQLDQCSGDEGCLSARRAEVSAAFFMEREFQDSGYYLYRLYSASFARKPAFAEFMPDRASLAGGANLEQSKQAFADAWVGRAQFREAYPEGMAASAFVNRLYDNAGVTGNFSEREAQINAMANGKTRAQVLSDVIENASFKRQEFNSAFVLTEYFSYLRRDPDAAGFNFWLNVLNNREPDNYKGMVCSFITSAEYQKRFSSFIAHTNRECGD
ncbi:MAG: DUF4214 domain-containing protein [Pyrinomonadaceae bacterium]